MSFWRKLKIDDRIVLKLAYIGSTVLLLLSITARNTKSKDFKTDFQALNLSMSVNGFLGLQHHKHNDTFKISSL